MESLPKCLEALINLGPEAIDRFGASLSTKWIEEALAATGTASVRRRKLPAEQAVWVVLGMSLYENRSIRDVVDHLSLVAPGVTSLAPSAISQARDRLGAAPMAWLFKKVADAWANAGGGDGYRDLALYAVDGTCMRVPDSQENFDHFGKPACRGANESGYPQLRLACLMNVGTRLLVDARFGPYATSERELAAERWPEIPANSLTILDRGFIDYANFASLVDVSRERHVLVRMREDMKPQEVEPLSDGTLKVRLVPCQAARTKNPDLPSHIEGRVLAYLRLSNTYQTEIVDRHRKKSGVRCQASTGEQAADGGRWGCCVMEGFRRVG